MSKRRTNASNLNLAANLAAARKGTFSSLIIRKQGEVRGGKRYGDDLVHVILYTGFKEATLTQKSLDMLPDPDVAPQEFAQFSDRVVGYCFRMKLQDRGGNTITHADVEKAVRDLRASLQRSLDHENTPTTAHVYEPLVVDGVTVRGARVYCCVANTEHKCQCRDCTGNKRAPVDGQINLMGLKIGERILEAAANGPIPASASRADVVAKDVIRRELPIARRVSYRLEPGGDYVLRAGGTAVKAAAKDGVAVDPKQVEQAGEMLSA